MANQVVQLPRAPASFVNGVNVPRIAPGEAERQSGPFLDLARDEPRRRSSTQVFEGRLVPRSDIETLQGEIGRQQRRRDSPRPSRRLVGDSLAGVERTPGHAGQRASASRSAPWRAGSLREQLIIEARLHRTCSASRPSSRRSRGTSRPARVLGHRGRPPGRARRNYLIDATPAEPVDLVTFHRRRTRRASAQIGSAARRNTASTSRGCSSGTAEGADATRSCWNLDSMPTDEVVELLAGLQPDHARRSRLARASSKSAKSRAANACARSNGTTIMTDRKLFMPGPVRGRRPSSARCMSTPLDRAPLEVTVFKESCPQRCATLLPPVFCTSAARRCFENAARHRRSWKPESATSSGLAARSST